MSTVITTQKTALSEAVLASFGPGINVTELKQLDPNPILAADSYKLSHVPEVYSSNDGMFAYLEARTKGDWMVFFGLQMFIQKFLSIRITKAHIDEAEEFAKNHIPFSKVFNRKVWEIVVDEYDGLWPLTIRAVPEGTRVPSGNVMCTIECTDKRVANLAFYLETAIQRGIWYPTTIATNDYKNWRIIRRYNMETADTLDFVPFQLHDFAGRGVTCSEQAEIGGAAHTVFFQGSDTMEGVRASNFYYDILMSAFSVVATEHSIQCSYGPMNQEEYIDTILDTYATPGAIVSMVLDGYDVDRESALLCSKKDKIIASGAKIVFRPDSGDPLEVIPRILKLQEQTFGVKVNKKGFKVINNVGIIQGDGIDTEMLTKILELVTGLGYSSDCILFGSGGGLLQKVNRDSYKFAQKASAKRMGNTWIGIYKDPITDPGKKSKEGRLTLVRSVLTGEYMTVNYDKPRADEWVDVMQVVYHNGVVYNRTTLAEVRARAQA